MSDIMKTSMKKGLMMCMAMGLIGTFFLIPATPISAQSTNTCYQKFPDIHQYSSNMYYYDMPNNNRVWLWISQLQYVTPKSGDRGTWHCDPDGGLVMVTTTELPACLTKVNLGVTGDPDGFSYTDATFGKVWVWVNNRYEIDSTDQRGDWTCSGDTLVLVGARNPNNQNANTGVQDNNEDANIGVQNNQTTTTTTTPTSTTTRSTSTAPGTQSTDLPLKIKLNNPLKVDTVQDAVKVFMDAVIKIAIPFIVVFFIWSGLQFILAQGNPKKLETAKHMFWYTVIGTLLILGAWAITDAIVGTVNSIAS
jgi:hypothetical protein